MNISILGAGAWGTALAVSAARAGVNVLIWSYNGKFARLDGVANNICTTADISDTATADAILIATPAAYFTDTVKKLAPFYRQTPVIICTKGADPETGRFMSEILCEFLPNCRDFGILSGPQFAAEVASGVPTASTIAGSAPACIAAHNALPDMFLSETDDIIGTQLCGVGKNAVSLIAGYNSVLSAGENERAMIFTRAWNEVMNIGLALGANIRTFSDFCGIGDLFLSATSTTSRNFSGGRAIAMGQAPAGTVEGISALTGLISRAHAHGVATPMLCEMATKMKLI